MMADSGLVMSKSPEKQASLFSFPGSVSCSVCLELITDAGERSFAKLKCGHHFHLDCIGSAFNAKGSMQCPNCRCVEEGQWLFKNGCHSFEDYVVDGLSYEDDFEVYAGIADLFHPPEELHSSHLHGAAHSLLPHQHVSVTLEGANPPANPNLVVNVLYGEHGGSSNPVRTCPYLAAQRVQHSRHMQFLDGNTGIPHIHEMGLHMAGGSHLGGNLTRTQRVSDRTVWNPHGRGPLASSNSAINIVYTEPPILPHERVRRSSRASGNLVPENYDLAFGQARSHRRLPDFGTGSLAMTSVMPNQGFEEPVSSMQNAASPALHNRLNGINQRPRHRESPILSPGGHSSDFFSERGWGAPWNMTSRVGGDSAGGLSGMDAARWNGSVQGHSWQRDRNRGSPWASHDLESRWNWFHSHGFSQPYGDVTSSIYYENNFRAADGTHPPM